MFTGAPPTPGAVAVIDTTRDEIVRVMATGPISKYVKASPDGHWLAISHWGDNTIGLIDFGMVGRVPDNLRTGLRGRAHDRAHCFFVWSEGLQPPHQYIEKAFAGRLFSHIHVTAREDGAIDFLYMRGKDGKRRAKLGA